MNKTKKYLILLFLLVGCDKYTAKYKFSKGDCFQDLEARNEKTSRIYQVMDSTEHTYITEVIAKHPKDDQTQWHPIFVSKYANIVPFDCIAFKKEGDKVIQGFDENSESMKKWTKAIKKLRKEYGIDK